MNNFTTNTYEMKRDIVNFSNKIRKNSDKPETKFVTDMIYGISKSKDVLLSSIAEALNEDTKKAYTINRLSDNLASDLRGSIDDNYANLVMDALGDTPVFLVDDSDIAKPLGEKFEDLGIVRDGSSRNKSYEKGYHHTEIVGLTNNMKQPISIFSKIHSSTQKEFISNNRVTYEGLDKVVSLLDKRNLKGIFVNDRGYDSNDIFNYYFSKRQYFVIRLTEKRKIYRNHKWYKITTLRDAYKGKIKINLMFQGEEKECNVSMVKAQITAQKKWINIIFIYGLSDTPMMLASNIAINNLNKMLTYTIGLIALLSEKINKREFVNRIIKESKSLKEKVFLWFYQLVRGIYNILSMARTGIREWENIRKVKSYDGQLSLLLNCIFIIQKAL